MLEDPKEVFGVDRWYWAANWKFTFRYPEVKKLLQNYVVPLVEMEVMMDENENNKVPENELGDRWYEKNKAKIETWWK